jgi:thymidylate kinase
VQEGYRAIALAEPNRIKLINAADTVEAVSAEIWNQVAPRLPAR